MRDGEIRSVLVHRLRENLLTTDGHIRIRVHGGAVELGGDVPTPEARQWAITDARRTPGVKAVSDHLVIRLAA